MVGTRARMMTERKPGICLIHCKEIQTDARVAPRREKSQMELATFMGNRERGKVKSASQGGAKNSTTPYGF